MNSTNNNIMSSGACSATAPQGRAGLALSPPCVPDLAGLSAALSGPLVLQIWEQYLEMYRQYLDVAGGECESDASDSDRTKLLSSVSSATSRKSAARRFRRARLRDRLAARDRVSTPVRDFGAGFGYLAVVKVEKRAEVSARVGVDPTVGKLLKTLAWSEVDSDALYTTRFVIDPAKSGAFKLADDGLELSRQLAALASVVEAGAGSLGEVLSGSAAASDLVLSPESRLGGSAEDEGFCYLRIVQPPRRDALASELGPNPCVSELLSRDKDWFMADMSGYSVVGFGHDQYHVVEGAQGCAVRSFLLRAATGLQFSGGSLGKLLLDSGESTGLGSLSRAAKLGVDLMSSRAVATCEKQFLRAMSGASARSLVVWVDAAGDSDDFVPPGVEPAVSGPVSMSARGDGQFFARVASGGLSVLALERGVVVRHRGIEYGSAGVTTYVVFRSKLSLGCVGTGGGAMLLCSRVGVQRAVGDALDSKSTEARFVRHQGMPLVLVVPSADVVPRACAVVPSAVEVTDPLDCWTPVCVWRYESSEYGSVAVQQRPWGRVSFSAFRSQGSVRLRLGSAVVVAETGAGIGVVISGAITPSLEADPGAARRPGGEPWSVRLTYCCDAYCMDRGGPSDSEYSDAV